VVAKGLGAEGEWRTEQGWDGGEPAEHGGGTGELEPAADSWSAEGGEPAVFGGNVLSGRWADA